MNGEPVSWGRALGQEIKFARLARGWSQHQLADEMHFKQPYISSIESGRQLASANFAEQADKVFGTPGIYTRMQKRSKYDRHPVWFVPYLELERQALAICDYSVLFVMGMLQTAEYAEAVFRSARPRENPAEIRRLVEERMQRRRLFEKDNPPSLWVILQEAALRSSVGGADVMRGQLQHLLTASESPHITIQVFPFGAGTPARGRPFDVMTRPNGTEILYQETYGRGTVDDSADVVAEARAAYDRLRANSLSPAATQVLIRHVLEEYNHAQHTGPDMDEVQLQREQRRAMPGMGQVELQRGGRRPMRRMGPRTRPFHRRHRDT
ncbi:helix-turn-helix transcriptional regulator [Streptomyces sp. UNOC14_S4]|uniref:helix-turn-helix domain-containing protein n=1 Tax=Streptomyces sp. UNOC14_S4 TaxID=2872340 RepID=UPI0027E24547|nr:helix-turn-helix transcriptional regulator [Streptomyces sp. UNOC14_S4]MCC3767806.1 helix-turn-helix transcriptional regulator [Streptomyces sp. UNOC14_S4]